MKLGILGLLVILAALVGRSETQVFAPTSAYTVEHIQGFTILVHRDVLLHEPEAVLMRKELEVQLAAVMETLPAEKLSSLRKVRFWVEWEKKENGAAEFHPSAVWLKDHGYNPEKAGCIELSNARNFVRWSQADQPWMVLHELAHAYHHLVLGERHADVEAAYKQAMDENRYESVDYINGGKKKAYASANAKEYFAELSEAYFGKNDFYPFIRTDLEQHDPVGYRLMQKLWGPGPNFD